jgi:hypothetical protein
LDDLHARALKSFSTTGRKASTAFTRTERLLPSLQALLDNSDNSDNSKAREKWGGWARFKKVK